MKRLQQILCIGLLGVMGLFYGDPVETTVANRPKQPTPDGYSGYAVFVADGEFDPTIPPDNPNLHPIPGMAPFLDGAYFQEEILGRTAGEIASRKQEAVDHIANRFGIDVNDPANAGRVLFINWMVDPRANYRAYSMGGENLSSAGREVLDGGWAAIIIDPNGFTLGGDFAGQVIPAGSLIAVGDYAIMPDRPNQQPIVISYKSAIPNVPTAFGVAGAETDIYAPAFGSGTGYTTSSVATTPDGLLQINARTVLTMPE